VKFIMAVRALTILGSAATIVAAIYAVVAYHAPPGQKTSDAPLAATRPVVSGTGSSITGTAQIKQESRGSNSPNIISGGNVSIGGK
jgi:hypothetical protein